MGSAGQVYIFQKNLVIIIHLSKLKTVTLDLNPWPPPFLPVWYWACPRPWILDVLLSKLGMLCCSGRSWELRGLRDAELVEMPSTCERPSGQCHGVLLSVSPPQCKCRVLDFCLGMADLRMNAAIIKKARASHLERTKSTRNKKYKNIPTQGGKNTDWEETGGISALPHWG